MSIAYIDLIQISKQDYQAAQMMESSFPDEFAVRAACYHLQQAVEKMLKAIILFHGETPKYTHDIEDLLDHCERLGETFSENARTVSDTLTVWEAKTRYDPSIKLNPQKYRMAKEFYQEVQQKVSIADETIQENPSDFSPEPCEDEQSDVSESDEMQMQ